MHFFHIETVQLIRIKADKSERVVDQKAVLK